MRRLLCFALLLTATRPLAAQVGYDPYHSPYRPIEHGSWLEAYSGRLFGTGGPIPLGPRDGNIYGAMLDFRGQHVLQLSLGAWLATAQRTVISAIDSVATRIKAPIGQRVVGLEMHVQFNLTGAKSFKRLAPFVGVGVGLAIGQSTPLSDTSGYTFGTKMYASPGIGARYFLNERLFLKGEAATIIWKINYPASYSAEPTKQPGTVGFPNAVNTTGRSSDYVLAPKLLFGFGWAF